jgi:hypothetical protein
MIGVSLWAGLVWVGFLPASIWPIENNWQVQHRLNLAADEREDWERAKPRTDAEYRDYIQERSSLTPEQKQVLIRSQEVLSRIREASEREHKLFMEELERDHQASLERMAKRKLEKPPKETRRVLQ